MGPDPTPRARIESLSREALARLHAGRADLARPLVDELAPLLAARPDLVAQMRQAVEVVGFDWPAQRRAIALSPVAAPAPGEVELVAFHVALPGVPSGVHGAVDYGAVLVACFESARLRAPGARRVLLTDERTALPDALGDVEVIRVPLDAARVMYERLRVQERFLAGRPAGRATVLMDSDVMVMAEPSGIFAEDFDVGITWRGGAPEAPFNGGMLFVNRGDAGQRHFARALACYEALAASPRIAPLFPTDLRAWWGDQFAHAALIGYRAFAERTGEAIEVDGVRLRFFPAETHNFTIEARPPTREELRGRAFVHFKGQRKGLQGPFLQAMRRGDL